jgi:crotonobetainyl-CoA:carnitine CoA-transferase CaiB-like acyl-CoA transferase
MVQTVEHPTAGPVRVTGVPVRLGETPGAVRTPPPRIGEHTRETLSQVLELSGSELDGLEREGVIASIRA